MKKIDKILNHDLFIENLDKNRTAEADRRFCRHDMGHFLDVARIARVISLEEGMDFPVEWIYGAALLHDIGRNRQYSEGIPHEQASAAIAEAILRDSGFDNNETDVIVKAILGHREAGQAQSKDLGALLYRADKASRACFSCPAERDCNWPEDKKNRELRY